MHSRHQGAWCERRNPEAKHDADGGRDRDDALNLRVVCRESYYRIRNNDQQTRTYRDRDGVSAQEQERAER